VVALHDVGIIFKWARACRAFMGKVRIVAMGNMPGRADAMYVFHHCSSVFDIFLQNLGVDWPIDSLESLVVPLVLAFQVIIVFGESSGIPNPAFVMIRDGFRIKKQLTWRVWEWAMPVGVRMIGLNEFGRDLIRIAIQLCW